jgi:predicted dehydrogenase
VLGCGPISQIAHFDACRKARNAELYAICDLAADLVAKMAAQHEPTVTYSKFDDMLADPKVEAVIIGVADQFHVPLARQAVAAGKHVLVEKPLGVTIEECEALRLELRGSKRVFQIGNNRRFDPGVAFARRFVREEMGKMMALKAWYYDSTARYTMTDNLQPIVRTSAQARRPEGNPKADKRRYFILGHGSHLVDTARFFGGEITAVRARWREDFGAHCWFVETEFASGALGHIDLIIPIRGDMEEGFQIFGEHGSAQGRVYLPWFHKSSQVECFSEKDRVYRRPLGEDAHTYKLQIEGFADAILHGAPQHGANVEDGVAAMRALVAIARSAETGARVRLAEAGGAV